MNKQHTGRIKVRPVDILVIKDMITDPATPTEVIRIDPTGRLFWHGREVTTDEDYRQAILEMIPHLFRQPKPLDK